MTPEEKLAYTINFDALQVAVRELIEAEVAHSWIGSQHPDDFDAIEHNLQRAKWNYQEALSRLRHPEK